MHGIAVAGFEVRNTAGTIEPLSELAATAARPHVRASGGLSYCAGLADRTYFVCDPFATSGPTSPSTTLLIKTVVKEIELPTLLATPSISTTSPTLAPDKYVICMSIDAPVFSQPYVAIASPPAQSTIVADTLPCIEPLELTCRWLTFSRALNDPFDADTRVTCSLLSRKS